MYLDLYPSCTSSLYRSSHVSMDMHHYIYIHIIYVHIYPNMDTYIYGYIYIYIYICICPNVFYQNQKGRVKKIVIERRALRSFLSSLLATKQCYTEVKRATSNAIPAKLFSQIWI